MYQIFFFFKLLLEAYGMLFMNSISKHYTRD